jgi:hypothetical protein
MNMRRIAIYAPNALGWRLIHVAQKDMAATRARAER